MWRQLSAATRASLAEPLADRLFELGALSVSFEDAGDQPLFEPEPGETPIWRDTRVIALFEEGSDLDLVRSMAAAGFAEGELSGWRFEEIQDQAWERAWLEHFRPMRFGNKLWVIPTGFEPPAPEGAVCVRLDPGLAFGTGTHPTTALCLQWLDGLDMQGKTVVDFGCGSGILAIAALLLGAQNAIATDIDPQALTATADNASKNGVEGQISCCLPSKMPPVQADILLANILAKPLIELAGQLAGVVKAGGRLALSGLLREQAGEVWRAYEPFFIMEEPEYLEDWSRLTGIRRLG